MRRQQGSLEYIEPFEKGSRKKGAQGSLEYIIIIGGVIIIAAATYFMLRGFTLTSEAGTKEKVEDIGDEFRLELENLGRSETRFLAKKWGSLPQLSRFTLNNTGDPTTPDITLNNLTDYGLNLSKVEFAYNDSGSIESLGQTIEGPAITFTTPFLPSGTSEILVFHNNSSALKLDNLNYTSYDPDVNITNGTSPEESPDTTPPTIFILATAYGSSGSVKDADIQVTVTDANSSITEVHYSIGNSPYFRADNLYYGYQDMTLEAHPEDNSYDSKSETIHLIVTVPSEDNYTVKVRAVDEYSNEKEETKNVSINIGPPSADTTPPAILSTQPANNSEVYASPITINISTNEIAHCRFSNESGISYSSMTDFNNTDSTQHNITNVSVQVGQDYAYYFKCNDTAGNVNTTDYVLNFTGPDINPPAILSAEPAYFSVVTGTPITINITTNEIAHCRFSNESGISYSSMTDFNNTDSLTHNITNVALTDGKHYTYYFRCNDTSGNVNETDHELSFTKSGPAIQIISFNIDPPNPGPSCGMDINFSVNADRDIYWCWLKVNSTSNYGYNYENIVYMNVSGQDANFTIFFDLGNHTANVNCTDYEGNVDYANLDFETPGDCSEEGGCSYTMNYTDSFNMTPISPTTTGKVDFEVHYPNQDGSYYGACELKVNRTASDVFVQIQMPHNGMYHFLNQQGPFPAGSYSAIAHCYMMFCTPESYNLTDFTIT